jgi:hypothetical protein
MSVSFAALAFQRVRLFPPYFWHRQMIQLDFMQMVSLWAVGYVATMVVFRICGLRSWWQVSAPVIGVVSAFVGLVLESSYYYCPFCHAPPEFPA